VDIVDVAGCLKRVVAQTEKRAHGILVPVLLDVPARRLGAEVDEDHQGHGGNEGAAELVAPGIAAGNAKQDEVCAGAEEDAESDVHLPGHDKRTANGSGRVFGGKNRDGGGLGTHTKTEKQTANKQLGPGPAESGGEDGPETEVGREEDGAATAEPVVEGVREPASDEGRGEVWRRVDQSDEQLVTDRL
jgi:hypothetical protein